MPPGSQVGSRSPSPLRTERAGFPALRSSMTNAPCGTRRCRCALRCIVNLTVTVGMEEDQIGPSVILVVAIPVMQFEVLLALDHLSADGTQSCLLVQDLCTKYRGCPQCSLSIMVLEIRLPLRIERVGVALDLDVALRCNRLLHPDDLEPARWISEPPGFARLMGEITAGDPTAGFIRVPLLGPSLQPPPDTTV
jgi:hypothetical protein